MDGKLVVLVVVGVALLMQLQVSAVFMYNRPMPDLNQLEELGLECIPGRTTIKFGEQSRRSHMNTPKNKIGDAKCKICVCSVEGKDEYCSTRPAMNVNECMRLNKIVTEFHYNVPFDLERDLSSRIRRVGSDDQMKSCVPFVSRYSDCTEANQCSGCTRCSCSAEGSWKCRQVQECHPDTSPIDEGTLNNALDVLYSELKNKYDSNADRYTPAQTKSSEDLLLDDNDNIEQKIVMLLARQKRSINNRPNDNNTKKNGSVKFHNTIDEMNEDTLKNSSHTGTLQANKVEPVRLPLILSRRSGVIMANNASSDSPLEVFSPAQLYSQQLTDNKIDTVTASEDRHETLAKQREIGILANHTQKEKNRELSKLIVNELKVGHIEVVGDETAPVMSNITFTPENDTLTAMAFIAGNLLNKLWSMEKESSDESAETEALKQEKISDLLELFKEPLSTRQELFIKNVLHRLSDVLDKNKDVSNASLCENIDEAKRLIAQASNSTWERRATTIQNKENKDNHDNTKESEIVKQKNMTLEAITKINDVLGLIKKFEGINKHLNDLKRQSDQQKTNKVVLRSKKPSHVKLLTDYENESKNLFGNILEKITKLLLPAKKSKMMINKIKKQNLFADSEDVKKRFKDSYKYDLGNMTLTTKDKLVLDYLTKIKSNPKFLLDEVLDNDEPDSKADIEGDILLNLSQFFKIKSFVDLMKLVQPNKKDVPDFHTVFRSAVTSVSENGTTDSPIEGSVIKQISTNMQISITTENPLKIESTKDRLKSHLKSILDDLVELQRQNGITTKEGQIRIADALPCIYKILNADENVNRIKSNGKSKIKALQKVAAVLDTLKKELKETSLTRRTSNIDNRPKSAVLWERVVKDINETENRKSRRNMDVKEPKTYEQLKIMIDDVESTSNVYKNKAILTNVKYADRLVLLKTLLADVEKNMKVLRSIKVSLDILKKLPSVKRIDIAEFIENAANNIKLDEKVLRHLTQSPAYTKANVFKENTFIPQKSQALMMPDGFSYDDKKIKFSRDVILNQLIKNRVKLYLKGKEDQGYDSDDMNYNIANNILRSLDNGNYQLARQLYKIFVTNKDTVSDNITRNKVSVPALAPAPASPSPQRWPIYEKEPLIQFEDPKEVRQQDKILKQLLALQNLKFK